MLKFLLRFLSRTWRPGRAAVAGLAATAVYSVAMETDQYVTGNHFNDVKFIQGLLGDSQARKTSTALIAWGLHFFNGVALAEVYAALLQRFLPGPRWFKGAIFGSAFVFAVWPLTPLVDRYHPLVKNGQLPPLVSWASFWQNTLRHLLFGLTLGLLYRERREEV